jgi:magnesium chelatase subunit D
MDKKIRFAKSLVWSLLKRSYENKNKIALLTFREDDVKILVPPTSDVNKFVEELEKLPTGGKTPLTPALFKAFEIAKKETKVTPVVILISDGRGNVFIKNSLEEDINFLSSIADNVKLIIVNTENKNKSIGVLEDIAKKFNKAEHYYLDEIML